MKDREYTFRGACTYCSCPEYANDDSGSIKCADCKCAATRHRVVPTLGSKFFKVFF